MMSNSIASSSSNKTTNSSKIMEVVLTITNNSCRQINSGSNRTNSTIYNRLVLNLKRSMDNSLPIMSSSLNSNSSSITEEIAIINNNKITIKVAITKTITEEKS